VLHVVSSQQLCWAQPLVKWCVRPHHLRFVEHDVAARRFHAFALSPSLRGQLVHFNANHKPHTRYDCTAQLLAPVGISGQTPTTLAVDNARCCEWLVQTTPGCRSFEPFWVQNAAGSSTPVHSLWTYVLTVLRAGNAYVGSGLPGVG
jgi:hypothetical protein